MSRNFNNMKIKSDVFILIHQKCWWVSTFRNGHGALNLKSSYTVQKKTVSNIYIYIYYMNCIALKRNDIFVQCHQNNKQQCLPRRPLGQVCWTRRQLHHLRWIHRVKLRAWQLHRILGTRLQRLLLTLMTSQLTWRHWKRTRKRDVIVQNESRISLGCFSVMTDDVQYSPCCQEKQLIHYRCA